MNTLRGSVRRWLKRIGIGLLALLLIAAATGSVYEMRARQRIAGDFPAPGELVDIGGRRIHLDCRGAGAPTVVFESGLDVYGSLSWSAVHDEVARITRACAYDRAGLMWSDRSSGARNGAAVAADLHKTLAVANEKGPYIMVGHSLGGPYIMEFTKRFGSEVAGLVFVDASHPDQLMRIREATGQEIKPSIAGPKVLAALAWTGLPRLIAPPSGHPKAPAQTNNVMSAYLPRSLGPMLDELAAIDETFQEAGAFRMLGDRPIAVLTAMAPLDTAELAAMKMSRQQGQRLKAAWFALHEEEATWSAAGVHRRLDDSGHYVQFDRPDAVIAAIRETLDSVRARP